jgi:hypothetical protein
VEKEIGMNWKPMMSKAEAEENILEIVGIKGKISIMVQTNLLLIVLPVRARE